MKNTNFQFSFATAKNTSEIFNFLINPQNWWVGLYGETIEGKSRIINDEFSFKAGDGVHYSNQKLVEIKPNRKIVWLVTDSNLSFLNNTREWTGTRICFEIEQQDKKTNVHFIHEGLVPEIECYEGCSGAWTQYLNKLEKLLNQ
jgi:hypothetical protein